MFKHIHHKPIRKFGFAGSIRDDSAIQRLRAEYMRLINSEMKILGYVPRLDIDPDFTISYNHIREHFEFTLSVYGSYVGKTRAQWTIGIDGTEVIAIQPSKSKGSLLDQESASNLK
jgi:hypothetical protein